MDSGIGLLRNNNEGEIDFWVNEIYRLKKNGCEKIKFYVCVYICECVYKVLIY